MGLYKWGRGLYTGKFVLGFRWACTSGGGGYIHLGKFVLGFRWAYTSGGRGYIHRGKFLLVLCGLIPGEANTLESMVHCTQNAMCSLFPVLGV